MIRVRLRPQLRAGRIARKERRSLPLRRASAGAALGMLTAAAALAGPAFTSPAHAATTPQYKLTLLGNDSTEAFGINKNGVIFGISVEKGAPAHQGFLLRAGSTSPVFLGSPGDPNNTNSSSSPEAINSSGDIVGTDVSFNTGVVSPVEWKDSATPTNLSSLGLQNIVTSPTLTSINDNGLITGFGSFHGDVGFTISGSTVEQQLHGDVRLRTHPY